MMVLDDAEVVVGENRNLLLALAEHLELRVVMAMSLANPGLAVDFEEYGLGRTYWVEGGKGMPLAEAKQAAMQAAA